MRIFSASAGVVGCCVVIIIFYLSFEVLASSFECVSHGLFCPLAMKASFRSILLIVTYFGVVMCGFEALEISPVTVKWNVRFL